MKSLHDIQHDMSSLYDELKSGIVEIKMASELANIAGKNLKAKQLYIAEQVFLRNIPTIAQDDPRHLTMENEPTAPFS